MKKQISSIAFLAMVSSAAAQFQFNPQLGINFTDVTDDAPGVESKAALGYQLGGDFRVGNQFYFQPGAFFGRNVTTVEYANSDTTVLEDNLVRTTLKIKALVGYNLVNGDAFKFRVNVGPTYEILMSVDNTDDEIEFNQDDYNAGSFNMDAGLGVDLSLFTAETGVSYGLSKTFKDQGEFESDAKYFTFYLTIGVVLGSGGD